MKMGTRCPRGVDVDATLVERVLGCQVGKERGMSLRGMERFGGGGELLMPSSLCRNGHR